MKTTNNKIQICGRTGNVMISSIPFSKRRVLAIIKAFKSIHNTIEYDLTNTENDLIEYYPSMVIKNADDGDHIVIDYTDVHALEQHLKYLTELEENDPVVDEYVNKFQMKFYGEPTNRAVAAWWIDGTGECTTIEQKIKIYKRIQDSLLVSKDNLPEWLVNCA